VDEWNLHFPHLNLKLTEALDAVAPFGKYHDIYFPLPLLLSIVVFPVAPCPMIQAKDFTTSKLEEIGPHCAESDVPLVNKPADAKSTTITLVESNL
jgi:hypothetical protein